MSDYNHVAYYAQNEGYATYLRDLPAGTYAKYLHFLSLPTPGRVLDVGCGAGQVVHALAERGYEAFGADACMPALDIARRGLGTYHVMTDAYLPFADASFDATGCYTVLEHVTEPETLLREMVRVLKPGGRIVVACPNFLRVTGLSSHHWHTKGTRRKVLNMLSLCRKSAMAGIAPGSMRFERMTPVSNADHFEADDDAIIVTNPVDTAFFLRRSGMHITHQSGALVPLGEMGDRVADLPLVRTLIGGVFLVGAKKP